MSKKSRRRNKRLAALAGLLGGAMLLGRGRGTAAANVDSGRGSGLRPTVDDAPLKKMVNVITPTTCLLYTSPSPRDGLLSRMPSSA